MNHLVVRVGRGSKLHAEIGTFAGRILLATVVLAASIAISVVIQGIVADLLGRIFGYTSIEAYLEILAALLEFLVTLLKRLDLRIPIGIIRYLSGYEN